MSRGPSHFHVLSDDGMWFLCIDWLMRLLAFFTIGRNYLTGFCQKLLLTITDKSLLHQEQCKRLREKAFIRPSDDQDVELFGFHWLHFTGDQNNTNYILYSTLNVSWNSCPLTNPKDLDVENNTESCRITSLRKDECHSSIQWYNGLFSFLSSCRKFRSRLDYIHGFLFIVYRL